MNDENRIYINEIKREYLNFLDDQNELGIYYKRVQKMISSGNNRLIVNINNLRNINKERVSNMFIRAHEEIIAFQNALKEYVSTLDYTFSIKFDEFYIGFEGSFGDRHVSPRSLKSEYLNNLVCCEGIITKCSTVHPKLCRSVHYCPTTYKTSERLYTDLTSLDPFPSNVVYPTKDEAGNDLETEYGFCIFRDHQKITLQEMPEKSPPGLLPRSVDVLLDGDLIDKCKPGDRVQIVGIYRCLPSKKSGYVNGTFRAVLLANYVQKLSKDHDNEIRAIDIKNVRKFASSKSNIAKYLIKSIAPSISGYDYIKRAILCMLVGGNEKVLDNGTRLRGDINILLVGDPSTAKSQLLRYVLHTAPRAISSNGRGSSGVGLTAAVTNDPDSGERRLEAGAMVLGDRGIVCIDEFDKMSDIDRTALHEVMEQGRVTISKAGIHAQLNARCSVFAAANPVYGRYDEYLTPMQNIGFPDSLLSRFDILFTVLDKVDEELDLKISEHVLKMRQFRSNNEQDGDPTLLGFGSNLYSTTNPEIDSDDEQATIYEKQDNVLYSKSSSREKLVSINFLKKYIFVAKQITPELTQQAIDAIVKAYTELREIGHNTKERARTLPVTARTLETLIRLSTAHAKIRLSRTVEKRDAMDSIELLHYAYFQKVQKKPKKQTSTAKEDGDDNDNIEDISENEKENNEITLTENIILDDDKMEILQKLLFDLFITQHLSSLSINDILNHISKSNENIDENDLKLCLNKMQDENKLMVSNDTVYLI